MFNFIQITDTDHNCTVIINTNQIVWFDVNSRTIMLSASDNKGLFHTDEESMGRLLERIMY